jgi:hypothetical protein
MIVSNVACGKQPCLLAGSNTVGRSRKTEISLTCGRGCLYLLPVHKRQHLKVIFEGFGRAVTFLRKV